MIEKQELYCHECGKYVQFELDMSLNGNHVLNCPNCGHEHCRVVKDGVISDDRWDSRNSLNYGYTYIPITSGITYSNTSTFNTYNSATASTSLFLYSAWMNTTITTVV